mgnify:CR=1 FL=1
MPLYGPKWPLSQGNHDTFELYEDVKQQIYLQVSDIQVGATAQEIDSNTLSVRIFYSIPGDVVQEVFELDMNPDNTIGFY